MKIIDLTQLMTASMPVYPGTEPPHLTVANTYETDGFRETLLSFFSHTGTHMDAPFHLFGDRTKLNEMPAAQFVGKALVISCMQYGAGRGNRHGSPCSRSAGLRMRRFSSFPYRLEPVLGQSGIFRGLSRSLSGGLPLCAGKRQKGAWLRYHRH